MRTIGLAVVMALLAAGSAHAAGIGLRAGTMGIGGDVAWDVAPTVSLRLGYSALDWNTSLNSGGVDWDAKLKLSNLNGFLDFHPLGPLFRITGGLVGNDNRYDLRAPSSFTLDGRSYSSTDVADVSGSLKSGRSVAPYLGIGWGNVSGAGVNFYADLGIMFMGTPQASLTAVCGPTLSASGCAQLQSDVAAEQARLADDVKHFKYYPVLNIGITIGF